MLENSKDVDVSKKDRNNFINLILQKISLVKNFHQRIAMSITSKVILNCYEAKFYLRKRREKIFLYTRFRTLKSTSRSLLHHCIKDINSLLYHGEIESIKGHIQGIVIDTDNTDDLVQLLKIIAILSSPQDFYKEDKKIYRCIYNYPYTSQIPIHFKITKKKLNELQHPDIVCLLDTRIKYHDTNHINTTSRRLKPTTTELLSYTFSRKDDFDDPGEAL